jgi:hypothetical protein
MHNALARRVNGSGTVSDGHHQRMSVSVVARPRFEPAKFATVSRLRACQTEPKPGAVREQLAPE